MRKIKKILIITSLYKPYFAGGAEYSTKILAENLENKYRIEILTSGIENISIEENNIKINRIFLGSQTEKILSEWEFKNKKYNLMEKIMIKIKQYFNKEAFKKVTIFLEDRNYDIYHITNNMYGFSFRETLKALNKKNKNILFTLRDPSFLCLKGNMKCEYGHECKLKLACKIYRKININILNKYTDIFHAPSKYMLNLYEKYGLKSKKNIVIPNTISKKLNFNDFNYRDKKNEILYIGNLGFYKGTKTLLKAFTNMNFEKAKLVFIGKGTEKQENYLKEKSKNLNVEFTGWIDKNRVIEKIKKAKIVVLPSEWPEAFGRTLIESLMNGTLVIGSNAGAIPEVVQNDDYIFPWGNDKELSKLIQKIMNYDEQTYNSELRSFFPKLKKFTLEEHIKEFEKLYDSIYDKELTDK